MAALDGRVVVITGAAGGLGREYAQLFAQEGARLVLVDIGAARDGSGNDPGVIQELVADIAATGADVVGNAEDISTFEGAERVLAQALDTYGEVHALVNSGGMLRDRMFVNMSIEEWDAVISGHLRAHFCPTRVLAGHWRDRAKAGEGVKASIVNTTSNAGLFSQPGQSNYAAAKAGIAGLTITLAEELSRYGIRVNAISPAARTRMTTEVPGMAEMVAAPASAYAFDVYHPGNVAPVVAWLSSAECRATGQVLYAQGGEVRVLDGWHYSATLDKGRRWTVEELDVELGKVLGSDAD
jgi:NAD(P)-dependent dehydrogenase (short-subunit alcohol dehydrogenase family)